MLNLRVNTIHSLYINKIYGLCSMYVPILFKVTLFSQESFDNIKVNLFEVRI